MFVFTDECVTAICAQIGEPAPERGGALLGPRHSNLITQCLYDEKAQTTRATYRPSVELGQRVRAFEAAGDLVLRGIVHSHPGTFDRPSAGDHRAFAELLSANPQMPAMLAPIVTQGCGDELAEHEVLLAPGIKMSCFEAGWMNTGNVVRRGTRPPRAVHVVKVGATVVAIQAATELLAAELAQYMQVGTQFRDAAINISGVDYQTKTLALGSGELMLLFPTTFPSAKPIALLTRNANTKPLTEELSFPWLSFAGAGTGELARQLAPVVLSTLQLETSL